MIKAQYNIPTQVSPEGPYPGLHRHTFSVQTFLLGSVQSLFEVHSGREAKIQKHVTHLINCLYRLCGKLG